jgi:hypothetical protein
MANWILRWNFSKPTYQPGDAGSIQFWLENTGDTYLHATEVGLQFEFQEKQNLYYPASCNTQVAPRANLYLSSVPFEIPKLVAGVIRYRACYHLWEYDAVRRNWLDFGTSWSENNHYIKALPSSYYRAFVTRGVPPEDRVVGDQIVDMIKDWGFETYTVGIEETADSKLLKEAVRDQIVKSDCLIAIATPRYLDALSGLWRTLEWLHGEVGIAYGRDRPILVLQDESIALGGLPGEIKELALPYNPLNLEELRQKLGAVMLPFREWVASRKREQFLATVARIGIPLLIGGISGFIIGRSR